MLISIGEAFDKLELKATLAIDHRAHELAARPKRAWVWAVAASIRIILHLTEIKVGFEGFFSPIRIEFVAN